MGRSGRRPPEHASDRVGRGLVLLGALALGRAACVAPPSVSLELVGRELPLRLEDLSGPGFRLLPGVGPVLAGRLEAARLAAGGRLDEHGADAVAGVGETLLARWRALRPR